MTTTKTPNSGLLPSSQGQTQKPSRLPTTVRFDPELKRQAEECARMNHMDFTTFLHFSLQTTMKNGGNIEPYYEVSDEYAKYLDDLVRRVDSGEEKTYGPFTTMEETRAFLDSIR